MTWIKMYHVLTWLVYLDCLYHCNPLKWFHCNPLKRFLWLTSSRDLKISASSEHFKIILCLLHWCSAMVFFGEWRHKYLLLLSLLLKAYVCHTESSCDIMERQRFTQKTFNFLTCVLLSQVQSNGLDSDPFLPPSVSHTRGSKSVI